MVDCEGVSVDTTEASEELQQLQDHASAVSADLLGVLRKTYTSLTLLGDIFSIVIPQWFNALISSVFMAQQAYTTLARAQALTGLAGGLGFLQAGVTFLAASMLFTQGLYLQSVRTDVQNKLNSTMQLLNVWS